MPIGVFLLVAFVVYEFIAFAERKSTLIDGELTTLQFLPQAQGLPYLLPPTNHLLSPDGGSKFELMDSSFFYFLSAVL